MSKEEFVQIQALLLSGNPDDNLLGVQMLRTNWEEQTEDVILESVKEYNTILEMDYYPEEKVMKYLDDKLKLKKKWKI